MLKARGISESTTFHSGLYILKYKELNKSLLFIWIEVFIGIKYFIVLVSSEMSNLILSIPKLTLISSFGVFNPFIHFFASLTKPRAAMMPRRASAHVGYVLAPLHVPWQHLLGQSPSWGYFAVCDAEERKNQRSSQDLHWVCSTGSCNIFILLVNEHPWYGKTEKPRAL